MPEVHPVEIADGGRAAAQCRRQIVETADQVHADGFAGGAVAKGVIIKQ